MTAGTAVREVIPKLKAEADVEVVGLVLSVDRMEKTKDSDTSAVKAVEAEFGFPVFAIANVREIFEAGQHIETADGHRVCDRRDQGRCRRLSGAVWCLNSIGGSYS